MHYKANKAPLEEIKSDVTIIFIIGKNFNHRWITHKKLLNSVGFKGEGEDAIFLASEQYIYVGIENLKLDELRFACARAYKLLKQTSFTSAKIGIYASKSIKHSISAMIEGFELGSYEFTKYKSKKDVKKEYTINISNHTHDSKEIEIDTITESVNFALVTSSVTNYAKNIINTSPQDYTPLQMADDAEKIATEFEDISCRIYDEKFLETNKMNAFLAVSKASVNPPRLIHLIYKPKNAKERVIFVGKGLTYDSGGLSLKPSDYMITMKADKSGGAAALAIIKGAAMLNLPIEIHAIIGATENMIGGNAYKPDDILVAKNGKTIEVRNTDAEGRLVLADCICYAQEFKPDVLIDIATLTGACVVGVGEYTTGLMGYSKKLKHQLSKAAKKSGELINPLMFNKHLKKLIKSSVADISNVSSSRYGGAITAGLFLDCFVEEQYKNKWLHLDIAGPAYLEKEWGYNSFGASGAGVRMSLYWLQNRIKGKK